MKLFEVVLAVISAIMILIGILHFLSVKVESAGASNSGMCYAFDQKPKFTQRDKDQTCCMFHNPHPYTDNKVFKLCIKGKSNG